MTSPSQSRITALLHAGAAEELLPLVYEQLHAIAHQRMRGERAGHTLQATALVHEAYLRMVHDATLPWSSRGHFFHAAAEAMRRILIEHARRKQAKKRGGGVAGSSATVADVADLAALDDGDGILALDEAFLRLEHHDPRAASVVRLRFYAGLGVDETAEALGLSRRTVLRDWEYARAFLLAELEKHVN